MAMHHGRSKALRGPFSWRQSIARGLVGLSMTACGASPKPAAAPPPPAFAAPAAAAEDADEDELGRAQRELKEAEQRVLALVDARALNAQVAADSAAPAPAAGSTQPKERAAESAPVRAESKKAGVAAETSAEADKASEGAERCELGCRALVSMRRASEAICRIVGEVDARCSSARERVRSAEQRLSSNPCVCNAESR